MLSLKSYCAKTDQGPYLQANEDDYLVDLTNGLFSVFDGFGGSLIGDKMTSLLKQNIVKFYTKFGHDPDTTLPFFFSPKYNIEANALINAMHSSQKLIHQQNHDKDYSLRGGASVISGVLSSNLMTFVATGNCQAYGYRKGSLDIVCSPDNLMSLSGETYQGFFQTAPLSGFGLFEDLHLTIKELKVKEGDIVVMCSDGVYPRISNEELKYVIERQDLYDAEKIERIFKQVNSQGNLDNQTLVILRF
jgi:serine/threonine protein phosphatase PrpC